VVLLSAVLGFVGTFSVMVSLMQRSQTFDVHLSTAVSLLR